VAIAPFNVEGLAPSELHIPKLLTETMSHEIADATSCRVVTEADMKAILDYEVKKEACTGESNASCLSEIGDALGVDFVISGTLGKLGNIYSMNVRMVDTEVAQVLVRAQRAVTNDPTLLRRAARDVARELFKLPPLSAEEMDVVEGATWLNQTLFWGGAVGVLITGFMLISNVTLSALLVYFVSFDRTPGIGGFKPLAQSLVFYPVALAVSSFFLLPIPAAVFGISFVVE